MSQSIKLMNEWTFPYKTCEKPIEFFIEQPVSFLINLASVFNLLYYAYISKILHIKHTIFSYLLFELFHTISHSKRFNAQIQTSIIHFIAYYFFVTTWSSLYFLTNKILHYNQIYFISFLVLLDLFVFFIIGGLWTVITGLTLIMSLFILYFNELPYFFKKNLQQKLLPGLILLFLLFTNEALNCDKMMNFYIFPYHSIIEILGFYLFHLLTYSFYLWSKKIEKKSV